eukprot:339582-Pyramimonas_sp.AAC.1
MLHVTCYTRVTSRVNLHLEGGDGDSQLCRPPCRVLLVNLIQPPPRAKLHLVLRERRFGKRSASSGRDTSVTPAGTGSSGRDTSVTPAGTGSRGA